MQIQWLLLTAIENALKVTCRDELPETDPTRPDLIKIGANQFSPTQNARYLCIGCGGNADPPDRDGIITLDNADNVGLTLPPREIFGGEYWWRRGFIELGCYFVTQHYDERKSTEYAYAYVGRVMHVLSNLNVGAITDEYGEHAIRMYPVSSVLTQSGGPPASYIWRGIAKWQCLTYRS